MQSRRTQQDRRGVAAVEAAIILPVLLVLMVLMWDLGQLIRGLQVVSMAAQEAGRQASTGAVPLATVKTAALNTLTQNGIAFNAGDPSLFSFQDITAPATLDPTTAAQGDLLAVTVSVDFNQLKFASAAAFWGNRLNISRVNNVSQWRSMRDVPVSIPWALPIN